MKRLFFLLALFITTYTFAQNSKITELEQQRKQALREISNTDKLLRDTKSTTSTLLQRIKLISNQISSRQKVLNLLGQEIDGIAAEQKLIEDEILLLEAELKEKQKKYAQAIDGMLNNRQSENKILFILSGKSLTESYRRLRYLREYSEWRSNQAEDIKAKSEELKIKKKELLKTKSQKTALLSERKTEQGNLKTEEINYQKEVGEAKQKQTELQKILAQKKKQADDLNRQIANLIAEEVARQEREAKRREAERIKKSASDNVASSGNKTVAKGNKTSPAAASVADNSSNSENIALSNNFASNRGKLPYPISGNYTITSRFGTHQHREWRVTTSNNGIDIQSQAGAEAKAVFNGEVSRVIAFPGYNNCIIMRHGNYYTFYANIQVIYVKQGDKLKTGQSLGKVYTDPDTGASLIHFQLWEGTNKLNPELWLR